jgi:hypothetical protein
MTLKNEHPHCFNNNFNKSFLVLILFILNFVLVSLYIFFVNTNHI